MRKTGATVTIVRDLFVGAPGLPLSAPLTSLMNGKLVTEYQATKALRTIVANCGADLDASKFTLHCGRVGGATALAAQSVPDSLVQTAGRWASQQFVGYMRPNDRDTVVIQNALESRGTGLL